MSKQKLLLMHDVEDLGRSGEVVSVKAGYARNFLIPKKFAVAATLNTLKMQEKLRKERAVRAAHDRKEAEELAKIIEQIALSIKVKVDAEGKMYGSVSAQDIISLLEGHNIKLTKRNVGIRKHIKEIGKIEVPIRLKEGVETKIILEILPEKTAAEKKEEQNEEKKPEKKKRARKTQEKKEEPAENE